MSLQPSTDLVMEVARAADPARASAVVERLNALGRSDAAGDFSTALRAAADATRAPAPVRGPPPQTRSQKAETQFESVMLSEFIGEMLPKDAPSAFGEGYAGDMWRSMLAERVADQIAASGRLGLASRLFASHAFPGSGQAAAAGDRPLRTP